MNLLRDIPALLSAISDALRGYDNHGAIAVAFIAFAAGLILLRIFSHLHLKSVLLSLRHAAKKDIKTKTDIDDIRHPILKRAVAEYIRTADRGVSAAPTPQIAARVVATLHFAGWKYTGLLPFIEAMEIGIIAAGLILAVIFPDEAAMYGLLAILAFVLCRLAAAFFDVRETRAEITDETIIFTGREISRFYATDASGAILRLKDDLADAMDRQAATFKATMEAIPHTMFGEGAKNFAGASDRLQSASDLLASQLKGHSGAISEQLITLIAAITDMKSELQHLRATQTTIATQGAFIESNQRALEASLHAYENSLQNLTTSIGDSLGAFINLHAQNGANVINEAMNSNIEKIKTLGENFF